MDDLLQDIVNWMTALPPIWAYLIILAISFGENVVPPIPGDLVVVFGGYLVGLGALSFSGVVVVATIGGTIGFMTMFAVGARIGAAVMDPHKMRWLPKRHIRKAREWIQRWGYWVISANRFLSGARSVISLTVGMAHMSTWKTLVCSTISSLLWVLIITYAGYLAGDNWEIVKAYLGRYGQIIVALLVLFAVFQIIQVYRKHKRFKSELDETAERVKKPEVSE